MIDTFRKSIVPNFVEDMYDVMNMISYKVLG
jgi:hypothetical protein